ncbi:hypothetical protein [Lactobacillus apis]|uniref:hypothetical protein n=1 Tax=Lactobacillus apis TaxID=303541 RepID=UPI00164FA405|nr:hypothetical protein [Lactobacillus apis]MBC6360561.1 hypothetical protein [Lactobacillus apis]
MSKNSFYLISMELTNAYLDNTERIKEVIDDIPEFKKIGVKPNKTVINISMGKPIKMSEMGTTLPAVNDDDYFVNASISIVYNDVDLNLSSAIMVSSTVEILNSVEFTLENVDDCINKNATSFLAPMVSKITKVLNNLLGEKDQTFTLPASIDMLDSINGKEIHTPIK